MKESPLIQEEEVLQEVQLRLLVGEGQVVENRREVAEEEEVVEDLMAVEEEVDQVQWPPLLREIRRKMI